MVRAHATEVDQWFLRQCGSFKILTAGGLPFGSSGLSECDGPILQLALERLTAARINLGVLGGQEALRQLGQSIRHHGRVAVPDVPVATAPVAQIEIDLWRNLTLLAQLGHDRRIERGGALRGIENFARDNAEKWARCLPWLLLVGPEVDDLDITMTAWLAEEHSQVVAALDVAATIPVPRVSLRARGLQARLEGAYQDAGTCAANVLAMQVDRHRDVFPRPLAGPAATWLADMDLEDLVRGGAKAALRNFTKVVDAQGAAEEEGLTQRLLALLERHLSELGRTLAVLGDGAHKALISIKQRTVPKSEERRIGADLGILVTVSVGGELHVRFGEVVQVKKTNLFIRRTGQYDSWRIEVRQLHDLLAVSPTAAYWLIRKSGDVLVVPAKFLQAVGAERCRNAQQTFTLRYTDVRHTAIGLDQYLCDLTLGMWVGSAEPGTVTFVSGSNSRTSPANVLEIQVRWIQG
ncbi:hypothetical protein ACIA47_17315 [Micromonospora sp. NPDC051227]|uniref:hypothetical protein n=1 Tax=Micromonospora sp. NPDC051227 TaxID=3364285 RepID=UPI0037A0644E